MKQLEVFNRIGGIIKELNDQYKYIEANPADLNELELELFVANAHFLADHADILIKLNLKNKAAKLAENAKETTIKEKYFEPVVRQIKPEVKSSVKPAESTVEPTASINLSSNVPEDSYSFIREEPEIIRHELIVDEAAEEDEEFEEDEVTNEQEIEEQPVATEEPVAAEKPDTAFQEEVKPIQEEIKPVEKKQVNVKEEVLTINQRMSAQLGNKGNVTQQLNGQPVTDLKQAITLNDKLLYVKDLFNGYNLAYSEAIEILNRFNTFEEAERFLNKNYVAKNNWENKPQTTSKFYAMLKRRYA